MPPVHRFENAIGAALHRQMQERHQFGDITMGRNQFVVDIGWVRRHVADASQARQFGEGADQIAQTPGTAVQPVAAIGVDVLAEQRDFARTSCNQPLGFGDDLACRPRRLCATV